MSHWTYNGSPFTEIPTGAVGFIYKITNLTTSQMYIGRKYVTRRIKSKINTTSLTAKNKKKTKIKIKESDWATYTGSCKPLNDDILSLGIDSFKFEILYIGTTKGQVNYAEEYIQFMTHAVLDPMYYNNSVGSRGYIAMTNNVKLLESIQTVVI